MRRIKLKKLNIENTTLSKLYLKNFKGFYEHTEINFRPKINLIFGKNSSGKSSILQAIRIFNQSHNNQYFTPFNLIPSDKDSGMNFDTEYREIISDQNIKNDLTIGVDFTKIQTKSLITAGLRYCYQFKNNFFPKNFPKKNEVILKELTITKKKLNLNKKTEDNSYFEKVKCELIGTNFLNTESETFKLLEERDIRDMRDKDRGQINSGSFQPYYYDLNIRSENIYSEFIESIFERYLSLDINYKKAILDYLKKISAKYEKIESEKDPEKKERNFFEKFSAQLKERDRISDDLELIKSKTSDSFERVSKINTIKDIDDYFELFFNLKKSELFQNSNLLWNFLKSKKSKNKKNFTEYFKKDFISKFNRLKFYRGKFKSIDRKTFANIPSWENKISYKINILIELMNLYEKTEVKLSSYYPVTQSENFSISNIYKERLIKDGLNKIKAIQITNTLPERFNITNVRKDYVGWNTENMVDLLSRRKNLDMINVWFKKLKVDYSIKIRPEGNYFNIVFVPNNKKFEIKRMHVGQGYSVFLPLIIDCLTAENKIFLCEEPEIHLHPKLQADIVDLITVSAKDRNNQFIFETHSEDFLLRVLKLVRDGIISNKDISINYVDKIKNKSTIKEIVIDENGRYTESWKDNIFADRLQELY